MGSPLPLSTMSFVPIMLLSISMAVLCAAASIDDDLRMLSKDIHSLETVELESYGTCVADKMPTTILFLDMGSSGIKFTEAVFKCKTAAQQELDSSCCTYKKDE